MLGDPVEWYPATSEVIECEARPFCEPGPPGVISYESLQCLADLISIESSEVIECEAMPTGRSGGQYDLFPVPHPYAGSPNRSNRLP